MPFVLTMFLLSRWAGGLVTRYGAKLPLVIGPIVASVGFAMLALPGTAAGSYWTSFFPAVVVMSLGMAAVVAPLSTTVMGAVEERHAGVASGINNAVSRTAGLISIAVLGIVMTTVYARGLDRSLDQLGISTEVRSVLAQNTVSLSAIDRTELPSDTKQAIDLATHSAFVSGFRVVMLIAALLGLLSSLAAILLVDGKPR
jgi:MFS family permease